ncbi:MAG: hypothetical protein CM15mP10_0110 [Actinomycetota bacterium]|nr:MAG: hypothetical protein CM15mP10_0110 [Actinomycetota bacterium]
MYHILLSLIAIGAPLNCEHASELIDSARNNPDKSEQLEITRVVIAHTDPMCFKDAKSRLKEREHGFKNPTTLGENQMAKVTYRGVSYDTETRVQEQKTQEPQQLVYRGIAVKGGK